MEVIMITGVKYLTGKKFTAKDEELLRNGQTFLTDDGIGIITTGTHTLKCSLTMLDPKPSFHQFNTISSLSEFLESISAYKINIKLNIEV